jgi:hypothetical protein
LQSTLHTRVLSLQFPFLTRCGGRIAGSETLVRRRNCRLRNPGVNGGLQA